MVLCASDKEHEKVEPLRPAEGSKVGDRVYFGEGNATQAAPLEPNRIDKKKIWEALQPMFKTGADRVAGFKDLPMLTAAGPITADSLAEGSIS